MKRSEITPGSFVYSPEEIYFKEEKAPADALATNTLGEFLILLGLSAVVSKTFKINKVLGTAAALSSMALGLKIITHNINKETSD